METANAYRATVLIADEHCDGKLTSQHARDFLSTVEGGTWDDPPEYEIVEVEPPGTWTSDPDQSAAVDLAEAVGHNVPQAKRVQEQLNQIIRPVIADYLVRLKAAHEASNYEGLFLGSDAHGVSLVTDGPTIELLWSGIFRWTWGDGWIYYTAHEGPWLNALLEDLKARYLQ